MAVASETLKSPDLLPEGAVAGKPGFLLPRSLTRAVGQSDTSPSDFLSRLAARSAAASYDPLDWKTPPLQTEYILADNSALKSLETPYQQNHVLNVYALQRALQIIGVPVVPDGLFGTQTRTAVVRYQRNRNLTADGIAGPKTQARIILGFVWLEEEENALPDKLLEAQSLGESGLLLTAVNWSKPGGVDVSGFQRRVYEPYTIEALRRAFDMQYQADLSAKNLRSLHDLFLPRPGCQSKTGVISYIPTPTERAWRCAALNHNYPSAADRYSRYDKHTSTYWTTEQTWVTEAGFKFEDGAPVKTPFDWSQNYALGSPEHNDRGNVCELVSTWPS